MPYTDFHYTPTGTGVISGKEVLEQTEDAINDLGTQLSGDVQTAINTANNALNTANTASADAQNAVNTANIANTAAQNAQNTANTAQNTASNALTAAQNAQNDVNALGNRVTTAEGNITQNTNAITGLTTRMGTAENNITTLQNDVITAQGTATSAQNTATLAREQAYVLRYASSAVTPNSTVAYSVLNNTDNIKIGDSLIDTSGQVFLIVSVDSVNETVTVGAVLLAIALDANVMHLSGNETATGLKTFSNDLNIYNSGGATPTLNIKSDIIEKGDTVNSDNLILQFLDKYSNFVSGITANKNAAGSQYLQFSVRTTDNNNANISSIINYFISKNGDRYFTPYEDNLINLGTSNRKWKNVLTNLLNGLNPGSMSMPDLNNRVDISGYITNLSGSYNAYTPLVDGWIAIHSEDATFLRIADSGSGGSGNTTTSPTAGILTCMMPVRANRQINVYIVCTTLKSAYFIPCTGNV